ncbi:MAG: SAM-dependent methyltransferase [Phormidesmis sp.]
MPSASLQPDYFEKMYAANIDPWNFETSEYEAQKYAATIAALPKETYRAGFEIGGSIGVLTQKLAARCQSLLSIDVSEQAQARAKERCQALSHVKFEVMQVPHQYPNRTFDLTLVSEVGYYWSKKDLQTAQQKITDHLEPGGHLLLVHWTPYVESYPLTGDEVHDAFLQSVGTTYQSLVSRREERYRLDLLERL